MYILQDELVCSTTVLGGFGEVAAPGGTSDPCPETFKQFCDAIRKAVAYYEKHNGKGYLQSQAIFHASVVSGQPKALNHLLMLGFTEYAHVKQYNKYNHEIHHLWMPVPHFFVALAKAA